MLTEAQWLGLCLRSESDQPHEWWAVGWAIRNRVLSSRYPDLFSAVILSRKQFSYFNSWTSSGLPVERIYEEALKGYAGDRSGWGENDLAEAQRCAAEVLAAPRWHAPFGTGFTHYWSPISMKPAGSMPSWAPSARRTFTPSGIDPLRFAFAEGVA
jgi:hypothetical protein